MPGRNVVEVGVQDSKKARTETIHDGKVRALYEGWS